MNKSCFRDMCYRYLPKRLVIDYIASKVIGRRINWQNPVDINDKINILKLTSDTKEWTRLSDKFLVREYISEKGLSDILVPLYKKYDKACDIRLEELPDSFVMKTNHGCGEVLIVKDKSKIDENNLRKKMDDYLQYRYGLHQAEYHYLDITPCIIVEQLLSENDNSISNTMIDYKIWCFDGKPYCLFVCFNRGAVTNVALYDLEWRYIKNGLKNSNHFIETPGVVPRPQNLDMMLRYASILSQGFPEVRVDLYNVNGKIYFGEMTFTSLGGFMNYYTDDFLKQLGNQIKI